MDEYKNNLAQRIYTLKGMVRLRNIESKLAKYMIVQTQLSQ